MAPQSCNHSKIICFLSILVVLVLSEATPCYFLIACANANIFKKCKGTIKYQINVNYVTV